MKKRLATGIVYVALLVGFFFLRRIDVRLFGVLIYAFSLIGTFEIARAFTKPVSQSGEALEPVAPLCRSQQIALGVYAAAFVPLYYLCEQFAGAGWGLRALGGLLFVFALVNLCLLVFDHTRAQLTGAGAALFSAVYPNALLAAMMLANDFAQASTLALLLIFVISPVADTFAFVVGSLVKGKKLCPNISPHKTISGAVGGVVFGTGASVLLYWLYTLTTDYVYTGVGAAWAGTPWVLFALAGLLCAVFTEFGDLVESIIKRKTGVKDMGKLLPGHGGVLDRIDGTLFASVFVWFVFIIFVV